MREAQVKGLRRAFDAQIADIKADIAAVQQQLSAVRPVAEEGAAPAGRPHPNQGAITVQEVLKRFEEKIYRNKIRRQLQ